VQQPIPPALSEKIRALGNRARVFPIEGYGYFFLTTPAYGDLAENDQMLWIKLGHVHDGERLLSTSDIIKRGWAGPSGVRVDAIQGSGTLVGLMKREPRCHIYRNLLSVPKIYYWTHDGAFIATNNLRLMANLLPDPQLNEKALAEHFMYLDLSGGRSYVRDVSELLAGKMLVWNGGTLSVQLRRDLRALSSLETQQPVNTETTDWFFEKLKSVVGLYVKDQLHSSGTMISGGPDSSLLQAAINALPYVDFPYPSFSFVVDTPAFGFEVEYAHEAVRLLGTNHTFVRIVPEEYPDRLVQSIEVLGQPMPLDTPPRFLALADYVSGNREDVTLLFLGHMAGGLHGVQDSLEIAQGDKYRNWPIPLLRLLGIILAPLSQSKSYGAQQAAQTLASCQDSDSLSHYLNSVGLLPTDLEMVCRCFPRSAVHEAFAVRRDLEKRYLDSGVMVEKANVLHLLTDGVDAASVLRQLGLWYGRDFIFPYADTSIVKATFSFEPIDRYCSGHRVKPVLKAALESQVPTSVTKKEKGFTSVFEQAVIRSMREGVLRALVHDIERPAFLEGADFERKLEQPDWFTWNLLTLDLFKKHMLG
jgi:hypothetical protein